MGTPAPLIFLQRTFVATPSSDLKGSHLLRTTAEIMQVFRDDTLGRFSSAWVGLRRFGRGDGLRGVVPDTSPVAEGLRTETRFFSSKPRRVRSLGS
jgi:hypothetical protein